MHTVNDGTSSWEPRDRTRRPGVVTSRLLVVVLGVGSILGAFAAPAHAATPANDNFANATVLGQRGQMAAADTFEFASAEVGEPSLGASALGKTLWYSYTPTSTGTVTFSSQGLNDTLIGAFTGSSVGSLTLVASNDNWPSAAFVFVSRITFTATAGTTYHIAVDESSAMPVAFRDSVVNILSWAPPPPNDAFGAATPLVGASGDLAIDNNGATIDAGEAHGGALRYDNSSWFTITSPTTKQYTLEAGDPGLGWLCSDLAVYSGTSPATLVEVAAPSGCFPTSPYTFVASAGVTYHVRLAGAQTLSELVGPARIEGPQHLIWSSGAAASVPGAPTNVVATPGDRTATITWQAPTSDGGAPITDYFVLPLQYVENFVCHWVGGPLTCTATGLSNGVSYTFVVGAVNAVGPGPQSSPSTPIVPSAVSTATFPGAPTGVTGAAGDASVAVSWVAPASDGGTPVTSYDVTASPGGMGCMWTSGPLTCTVSGLSNGTPYTFRVRATNAYGTGAQSDPSAPVIPIAAVPAGEPRFHALTPARVLDTRPGPSQVGLAGAFGAAQSRLLQVVGNGGVPVGATSVVLNVTAVQPSAYSFLSITPEAPSPGVPVTTSSLNLTPGSVRPNLVVAKLDALGRLSIYNNSGTVDVLADVVGWFDDGTVTGDSLTAVPPQRVLDTRPGPGQVGLAGAFGAAQARVLQVSGTGGVPVDATAVVMNVTSVNPSAESFLSVTPDALGPGVVPGTSNLNLATATVRPNLVVVKLNGSGQVTIYNNSGNVDVLADVVGYFSPSTAGPVQSLIPSRILDTRPGVGQVGLAGAFGPAQARVLQVAGQGGVPSGAKAVWMNVTSVNSSAPSFLSVVPDPLAPGQVPSTSNLNLATGQVVPNLVLVKLNVAGQVTIYNNSGTVDVLADVVAYVP